MLNRILTDIETAFTKRRRKFIYKVATYALLVISTQGFLDGDVTQQMMGFVAIITGMADIKVDSTPEDATAYVGKHREE